MATAEPVGRWVLHRAGIRNVWQYDNAELAFAGGRLLLRGMNGAGKSKALELLLPFLVDGDTRQIDATQRDRTTVRWLMTADRDDGDHVGYVWLELRLVDADDNNEHFRTLGAGLKASTRTGKASSWYFITHRRVGVDLALDVDREPLSIDKLRSELGEDAVVESGAEHRRRVGRLLFGLHDDTRFANLLHLLHQLRDPNVGNLVEAGQLAQLLSNALPPLDDRFLDDAAARLDDLEQVKAQVERAERAAATLVDFLGVYQGYARRKVHDRAAAAREAARDERRARRAVDRTEAAHRHARTAEVTARELLQQRRDDRQDADRRRRAIELSPAYRDHRALVDKEHAVAALADAFASAQLRAGDSSSHLERAMEADGAAQRAIEQDTAIADERLATAARDLQEGGVDAGLLPRLSDDGLDGREERLDQLLVVLANRRDRVREVRGLARQHERDLANVERARTDEAASEAELDTATATHQAADQQLDAAVETWTTAVQAWWRTLEVGPLSALDDALQVPADEIATAVARCAPRRARAVARPRQSHRGKRRRGRARCRT